MKRGAVITTALSDVDVNVMGHHGRDKRTRGYGPA
jgi:hypothetical protein